MILISYVVFKEHLNICSIRIVNGLLHELFSFACVCLNYIMFFFVSYDKFLAMWLVCEFFRFSKVESVSTFFFSPRLLLSNWYYCVIWCISGEKSLFVQKRSTSGKPAYDVLAAKKVCSCEKSRLVENWLKNFCSQGNSLKASKRKKEKILRNDVQISFNWIFVR